MISSLDLSSIESDSSNIEVNDNVYVTLDVVEGYAEATGVYRYKPTGGLFLQGKVTRTTTSGLNIVYGIESYFVPEGQGRKVERVSRGNLDAKVAIDNSGRAVIKTLLIEGEEIICD